MKLMGYYKTEVNFRIACLVYLSSHTYTQTDTYSNLSYVMLLDWVDESSNYLLVGMS